VLRPNKHRCRSTHARTSRREKDRAKLALQMKRFKEQQMAKADAQLLTVLEMV
jgi:hypothetical protein